MVASLNDGLRYVTTSQGGSCPSDLGSFSALPCSVQALVAALPHTPDGLSITVVAFLIREWTSRAQQTGVILINCS